MTVHGSRCLKRCAKTTLSGIPSSLKYGKRDPDTILGIIYYMYVYRKYLNAKETGLGRYTCEQGKNNIEGLVPIYNVIPFNIAFSHFFFKKGDIPVTPKMVHLQYKTFNDIWRTCRVFFWFIKNTFRVLYPFRSPQSLEHSRIRFCHDFAYIG